MALPYALPTQYTYSNDEAILCGPIDVNGTLYAVVIDTTNGDTRVVRSNDQFSTIAGSTSLGATNTGTVTAMCYGELYGTDEFCTLRVDTNEDVYVDVYNTTSDSITTTSATGPSLSFSGGGLGEEITLCIRSNGDVIVVFGGQEKIMGTEYSRVNYSIWDRSANSWSASVSVSPTGTETHYFLGGCEVDSSDRAHIFYTNQSNSTLIHRALSSGNSLGTANTVVSSIALSRNVCGQPNVYTDGTEKTGIAVRNSSNQLVFASGDVGNSITTWTTTTQSTYTLNNTPPQLLHISGDNYFFWVQSSDNELQYSVYDGAWGTPTAITSATTTDAVSINENGSNIGTIYQSSSNLFYDEVLLFSTYNEVAFGGAVCGGSGEEQLVVDKFGNGGFLCDGTAFVGVTVYTFSLGGVLLNSTAFNESIKTIFASGGILISGEGYQNNWFVAEGGAVLSGSVKLDIIYKISAIGGCQLSGVEANYFITNNPATGGNIINGIAQIFNISQVARPISDISTGGWKTNLFA